MKAHYPGTEEQPNRSRVSATIALFTLALGLAGCGGTAPPAAVVTPVVSTPTAVAPTPTPLPPTATPWPLAYQTTDAHAGAIVWATRVDPKTHAPLDQVTSIPANTTALYAVIPFPFLVDGAKIRADWSYNDTALPALASEIVVHPALDNAWIAFQLARSGDADWPAGTYQVTVSVNGQPALASTVKVEATDGG